MPRVLSAVVALGSLLVVACGAPPASSAPATLSPAPSVGVTSPAASVSYTDAATGITFEAPPGLVVTPAMAMPDGTTTQALFTTYDPARTGIDFSRELSISASVVKRAPNEDMRAFAARSAQGAAYSASDYPRLGGLVIEGTFQTGRRKYLLVPHGPDLVLIVDAFPTSSSRLSLFDSVLATLQMK